MDCVDCVDCVGYVGCATVIHRSAGELSVGILGEMGKMGKIGGLPSATDAAVGTPQISGLLV